MKQGSLCSEEKQNKWCLCCHVEMRLQWEHHKVSRGMCIAGAAPCSLASSQQCFYLVLSRGEGTCHVQLHPDLAKWQISIRDQEELLIRNDRCGL